MEAFLHAVIHLFPCMECRRHAIPMLRHWWRPEAAASRCALQQLLCGMHNEVNRRKGKAVFPCNCGSSELQPDRDPSRARLQGRNLVLEPIGLQELGRTCWMLLHAFVETYPRQPSLEEQRELSALSHGLFIFFPSEEEDWGRSWIQPRDRSRFLPIPKAVLQAGRTGVMRWACKLHNLYNVALRRGKMPCLIAVPKRSDLRGGGLYLFSGRHRNENKDIQ